MSTEPPALVPSQWNRREFVLAVSGAALAGNLRAPAAASRRLPRSFHGPEFPSRELRLAHHVFARAHLLRQQLSEPS